MLTCLEKIDPWMILEKLDVKIHGKNYSKLIIFQEDKNDEYVKNSWCQNVDYMSTDQQYLNNLSKNMIVKQFVLEVLRKNYWTIFQEDENKENFYNKNAIIFLMIHIRKTLEDIFYGKQKSLKNAFSSG